ncbi:MAG: carboxylating nicotinate-nucleotide diphosphorylase, partial [Gammaproteobacteria bacterium]|nr:carboxylating nicotinate-nucleotide diphosphorylase [Gammaproteobacteria bacterium]
ITAQLIDPATLASGEIITRESMVLCGIPWADSSFKQTDETLSVSWLAADGEKLSAGQTICQLRGTARSLLTAERTALNFLQLLSGTATMSNHYSELIRHTGCKLLDTRKTLPGLRNAQKYAIRCGGAQNHRTGLYDAFLIKENHILACGSITQAIKMARSLHPDKRLEIEVENLTEYGEAMMAGPDWIMLDNFSLGDMRSAVKGKNHAVSLEASGGIESEGALIEIAESGVDYISMGALTKHVRAIDLSMRLTPAT